MINLFNINNYTIDTSKLGNILHGSVVTQFEEKFAEYVGAKYACFANSASSLLFLSLLDRHTTIKIPSVMPAVVPNVIVNTHNIIEFYDDIDWVGHKYLLCDKIYDSAQEVTKDQHKDLNDDDAVTIFSFYPTKPVGGCDGGMVVSNNKRTIDWYKMMVLNGMNYQDNNWERTQIAPGFKMHGSSVQAYVAYQNLKKLDNKYDVIDKNIDIYNKAFGLNNTSRHLYRLRVKNNKSFINKMKEQDIVCGMHYECCHKKQFFCYDETRLVDYNLPLSELEAQQTVSIPCHEKLSADDVEKIIKYALQFKDLK